MDGRSHDRQLPHRDGQLLPQLVAALGAGRVLPQRQFFRTRRRDLRALAAFRATSARPRVLSADHASDDIVDHLDALVQNLGAHREAVELRLKSARPPRPRSCGRSRPNAATLLPGVPDFAEGQWRRGDHLVDGISSDATVEVAEQFGAVVLSDEGKGLPAARLLGAERARTPWVVLVDADVVWPPGTVDTLLEEFEGYDALQAGLKSVGGPEFWGRALAHHHRTGRSRRWFGLVATVFRRDDLLAIGFDSRFMSGEDIDLRWRLRDRGLRIGVSSRTTSSTASPATTSRSPRISS